MVYGSVYVARVAFGAKDSQTVNALCEADSYPGTSLVIAYSHCIAHGYDMAFGLEQQKRAVDSWTWPLYRFDPRRKALGQPALQLDCGEPKVRVADYMSHEARFLMVEKQDPERFRGMLAEAQAEAEERFKEYRRLAAKEG